MEYSNEDLFDNLQSMLHCILRPAWGFPMSLESIKQSNNRSTYPSVLFDTFPSTALLKFLPPDEPMSSCRSIPDVDQRQLCDTLGRKKSYSWNMMIGVDSVVKIEFGGTGMSCTMFNVNNGTSKQLWQVSSRKQCHLEEPLMWFVPGFQRSSRLRLPEALLCCPVSWGMYAWCT